MLLLLITFTFARNLITSIPINPSLTLSILELDAQTQHYTLTRDLTQGEGWFALGFPTQNDVGMDNTRAVKIRVFFF